MNIWRCRLHARSHTHTHTHTHTHRKQQKQKERRPGFTEWALCVLHLLDSGQRVGQFFLKYAKRARPSASAWLMLSFSLLLLHFLFLDTFFCPSHVRSSTLFAHFSSEKRPSEVWVEIQEVKNRIKSRGEMRADPLDVSLLVLCLCFRVFGGEICSSRTHAELLPSSPAKSPQKTAEYSQYN